MALAPKGRAFVRSREHASRKRLRLSTLILFSAIAFLLFLAPFRSQLSFASKDDGGAFSGVLARNRNHKNNNKNAQRVGSPAWQQMMNSVSEMRVMEGEGLSGKGGRDGKEGEKRGDDKLVEGTASVRGGEEEGGMVDMAGDGIVEHDLMSRGEGKRESDMEKKKGGADVMGTMDGGEERPKFVEERDLMTGLDEKVKKEHDKLKASKVDIAKPEKDDTPACLRHIIYDKPVKTGSTAVTVALQEYMKRRGEEFVECTFESCGKAAREVCDGKRAKTHFVEHISAENGLLECLKRLGYYRVTSVREPLDRWESSFLYNRKKKATHYGIGFNESYARFMSLYPDCSLFDYYDGLGKRCDVGEVGVEERIERIVNRYEEIIDLYNDKDKGQLHRMLADGLKEENRSPRPPGEFRQWFDKGRLGPETRLYKAFKARQRELVGKEPKLC